MNKIAICLCIAFFISGVGVGMILVLNSDFTYQNASIMTCEYANALTDIVNNQSELLKSYTGTDHVILDQLNCWRLKE